MIPFLIVVLAGQALANLDNAIVNVATPSIGATLHATGAELQLTIAAYVLVSAVLLVPSARLGSVIGQRRMFCVGMIVFTAASLACGLAPGSLALIIARAVQGIGAACMVAQVLASIGHHVPATQRSSAIAAYTTTLSLSSVVGQLVGGGIVWLDLFGLSWRPLFLINVPLGIAVALGARRWMPPDDPSQKSTGVDWLGIMLLGAALLAVILPLTLGRELQWPPWSLAMLGASAPLAYGFVAWERRCSAIGRHPVLQLALFDDLPIRWGLIALACARVTYFSLLFVIAQYLQTGRHASALVSGGALAVWAVGYGCAGPLYPRAPVALARRFAQLGCAAMASAFACIALTTTSGTGGAPMLIALLGCGGIGFGCVSTASIAALTRTVTPVHAADLSGILATMVPLTTVLGVATFGTLYLMLASAPLIAFAIVCMAFSVTALIGAAAATRAERMALLRAANA